MRSSDGILLIVILLFFVSWRYSMPVLQWIALSVPISLFLLRRWAEYVKKHLHIQINLKESRLFPGEQSTGELILINQSRFPLVAVDLFFLTADKLQLKSDVLEESEEGKGVRRFRGRFSVGAREKVYIPFDLTAGQRGVYRLMQIVMETEDFTGLYKVRKEIDLFDEILVYPEEQPMSGLEEVDRIPQGDTVVKRWIHEDPFFPAGARPYQLGDSFSRIDFKTTARLGTYYSKRFDFTAHRDVCVISNLMTSTNKWEGVERSTMERNLSMIAFLAREALENQQRTAIFLNVYTNRKRLYVLPSDSGRHHYRRTMEALARFDYLQASPFAVALMQIPRYYPNGALLLVVTSYLDREIEQQLNRLVVKGFDVCLADPSQPLPRVKRWLPTGMKGEDEGVSSASG